MILTSKAIMSYTAEEHTQIRTALNDLASHHLSLQNWTEVCKGISDKKINCASDGASYSLFSVLFYIMDGFLPMMRKFVYLGLGIKTPNLNAKIVARSFRDLMAVREGVEVSQSQKVNITQLKVWKHVSCSWCLQPYSPF